MRSLRQLRRLRHRQGLRAWRTANPSFEPHCLLLHFSFSSVCQLWLTVFTFFQSVVVENRLQATDSHFLILLIPLSRHGSKLLVSHLLITIGRSNILLFVLLECFSTASLQPERLHPIVSRNNHALHSVDLRDFMPQGFVLLQKGATVLLFVPCLRIESILWPNQRSLCKPFPLQGHLYDATAAFLHFSSMFIFQLGNIISATFAPIPQAAEAQCQLALEACTVPAMLGCLDKPQSFAVIAISTQAICILWLWRIPCPAASLALCWLHRVWRR